MNSKRLLFLLRHGPYRTSHALEAIETALVAGVFEHTVSVLWLEDGVWQLVADQHGDALNRRTVGKVAAALPQYDVERLYVCAESLRQRGLATDDLALPVEALELDRQAELLAAQDAVVND